jgi:protein-tyrosine phosphatase
MRWDYDRRDVSLSPPVPPNEFTPEIARAAMLKLYRTLPTALESQYAWLLGALAAGQLPLLVNCSAGKDRTGVAAALALACLGVSLEDVISDFCLTDQVVDLEKIFFDGEGPAVEEDHDHAFVASLSREARAPLLKALPAYLYAAFEQIARDHGSVLSYVHSKLHITEAQIASLQSRLLES